MKYYVGEIVQLHIYWFFNERYVLGPSQCFWTDADSDLIQKLDGLMDGFSALRLAGFTLTSQNYSLCFPCQD